MLLRREATFIQELPSVSFDFAWCFFCPSNQELEGMYEHVRSAVEKKEVLLEWDYSKV